MPLRQISCFSVILTSNIDITVDSNCDRSVICLRGECPLANLFIKFLELGLWADFYGWEEGCIVCVVHKEVKEWGQFGCYPGELLFSKAMQVFVTHTSISRFIQLCIGRSFSFFLHQELNLTLNKSTLNILLIERKGEDIHKDFFWATSNILKSEEVDRNVFISSLLDPEVVKVTPAWYLLLD